MTAFLVTAGVLLLGLPAVAVDEVDDFVELPFAHYGDMLVDRAHGQVFVTGGWGSNEIAVVSLDGTRVTMIPGTPGASMLSMTEDGQKVYANLVNGDGIAEIDTTTLAVRRLPTGQGSCPQDVAALAGYVWYVEGGGDCNQWMVIRRLDPAKGTVSPDVMAGSYYSPVLRVLPGTTKFLFAETGVSSSDVGVFDVADGTLTRTAFARFANGVSRDLRLTADGEHFITGQSGAVAFFRTTDFSADGVSTIPGGGWPSAAAADDDIVVVARGGTNRVEVLRRGSSTVLNSLDLGPAVAGVVDVDLLGERLFAVTQGETIRLYQVPRPAVPAPTLTLQVPSEAVVGRPTTVSGTLSDPGAPLAGQLVTVRRDDTQEVLGTATTDADGVYSVALTAQARGPLPIAARSHGSDTVKSATTRAVLNVVGRPLTITLSGPASVEPGAPVILTGSVSEDGVAVAGLSLRVERRCGGPSSSAQPLSTVVTGSDGTFTVDDQPGSCSSYTYFARYDGNEVYAPGSASAAVKVNWVSTWIDLGGPLSTHIGEPVRISGSFMTGEGPLPGTTLTAQAATPAGPRDLGTVTVDDSGRFELRDTPETFGTYCYTVGFAGDSRRDPAEGRYCLSSLKLQTDLVSTTAPFVVRLDEPVLLTGQLNSNGEPLAGAELLVSRSDSYGGTEMLPTAVTGADGHFTIRDVPPAGGEVRYAVSYPSTPTRTGATWTRLVTVTRPARTLQIWTDRVTYAYGQTAQIAVDLATDSSRITQVYAQEAGRGRVRIFSGEVTDAGVTLTYPMRRNTEFSAFVREDGRALAAYTAVSRLSMIGIATKSIGAYGSAGRYALYRPKADPTFDAAVRPIGTQGCLRFEVQRQYANGWRLDSQSDCLSTPEAGTARWTLTGDQAQNTPYRARLLFSGDDVNAATRGSWVYFRFVQRS